MVPSLPLMSCELSVSVKENPDIKKKIQVYTQKKRQAMVSKTDTLESSYANH